MIIIQAHVGNPAKTRLDWRDSGVVREAVEQPHRGEDLGLEPLALEHRGFTRIGVKSAHEFSELASAYAETAAMNSPTAGGQRPGRFERLLVGSPGQHPHR